MRAIIIAAGAVLTLSACGGAADESNVDTLEVNNLVVDDGMGDNAMMDANGMMMDGNAMMDANTANAVATDLNTNDPDTNLANGY